MQEKFKYLVESTAQLVSLQSLIKLTGITTVLPFYHTVSDEDLPHLNHLYPVINAKVFEQHLDYFLKHYKPASYKHLLDKTATTGNHFIISFDDGLSGFYDLAAPILERKGIPAICFINSSFVDNQALFYRLKVSILIDKLLSISNKRLHNQLAASCNNYAINYTHPLDLKKITDSQVKLIDELAILTGVDFDQYLSEKKPYLTRAQLKELAAKGFTIGAHSVTHPYFPSLSEEMQLNETLNSVRYVKQEFGMNDGLFSFPYTDFGIKKSFFSSVTNDVCLTFGTANLKRDCITTNHQRIPMEVPGYEDPARIIKNQYLLHWLKQLTGRSEIKRN